MVQAYNADIADRQSAIQTDRLNFLRNNGRYTDTQLAEMRDELEKEFSPESVESVQQIIPVGRYGIGRVPIKSRIDGRVLTTGKKSEEISSSIMSEIEKQNRTAISSDARVKSEQATVFLKDMMLRAEGDLSKLNTTALYQDIERRLIGLPENEKKEARESISAFVHRQFFPWLEAERVKQANQRIAQEGIKDKSGKSIVLTSLSEPSTSAAAERIRQNVRAEYLADQMQYAVSFGDNTFVNNTIKSMQGMVTQQMVETGVPQALKDAYMMYQMRGTMALDIRDLLGKDAFGIQVARILEIADTMPGNGGLERQLTDAYLFANEEMLNPNRKIGALSTQATNQMVEKTEELVDWFRSQGMANSTGTQSLYIMRAFRDAVAKNITLGKSVDESLKDAEKMVKASTIIVNGSAMPAVDFDNRQMDTTTAQYISDYLSNGNERVRLVWVGTNANSENLYALMTNEGDRYIPTDRTITNTFVRNGEAETESFKFNPGAMFTLDEVWNDRTKGTITVEGMNYRRYRKTRMSQSTQMGGGGYSARAIKRGRPNEFQQAYEIGSQRSTGAPAVNIPENAVGTYEAADQSAVGLSDLFNQ